MRFDATKNRVRDSYENERVEKASGEPAKMLPYSPVLRKIFVKSFKLHYSLILLVLLAFAALVSAQTATVSTGSSRASAVSANFMRLNDVKEGMRGTAKTVFRGSVPEEFSVEILGVVPGGIGPKQDMIVGRISGTVMCRNC